jgi:aspartyl-tRNA synthetase
MGGMSFIDVRDRYGITQAVTDDPEMNAEVAKLGREFVIQVIGTVRERERARIRRWIRET